MYPEPRLPRQGQNCPRPAASTNLLFLRPSAIGAAPQPFTRQKCCPPDGRIQATPTPPGAFAEKAAASAVERHQQAHDDGPIGTRTDDLEQRGRYRRPQGTSPTAPEAMDLAYRHGGSTSFKRESRLAEGWCDLQLSRLNSTRSAAVRRLVLRDLHARALHQGSPPDLASRPDPRPGRAPALTAVAGSRSGEPHIRKGYRLGMVAVDPSNLANWTVNGSL